MKKNGRVVVKALNKQQSKGSLLLLAFVVAISFVSFTFISFFIKAAYDETRETFLKRLSEEKQVADTNRTLKTELLAITQKGYVEFAAGERLGLKKPKEEEVLVLR